MGVRDIYRDRASLGHIPVLRGQTLIETPYRLQLDANTYGLWWCNEGMGPTLLDKATTPHIGTISNPVWSTDGPWGVGLDDAAGSLYADFGNYGDPGEGSLTVELVLDAYGMNTSGTMWGISLAAKGGWGVTGWYLVIHDFAAGALQGKVAFGTSNGTEVTSRSTTVITDLHACYIVGVLDRATGKQRLFINGVQEGADADVSAASITSEYSMQLLSYIPPNPTTRYTGKAYLLRVSLAARSSAEILTNAKLMGFA